MLLITGGLGFLGHHLARRYPDALILDAMTYAAHSDQQGDTYIGDVCESADILRDKPITTIIHAAAETHVDRSFVYPSQFVKTNVQGTLAMLDAVVRYRPQARFIHISSDEVYGSTETHVTEQAPMNPGNPYSASKAGADAMVLAYVNTYGIDAIIGRFSNFYGSGQYREKLIPRTVHLLEHGRKAQICGDGLHTRQWLHVSDAVEGIDALIRHGARGQIYNFGGDECTNLEMIKLICYLYGNDNFEFVPDRHGNDRHYRTSDVLARYHLDWQRKRHIATSLSDVVNSYR